MGRKYAGVLGPLAFATVLAQGVLHGSGAEATLQRGIMALAAFAVVGAILGGLAAWNVKDSVRARLVQQLMERQAAETRPK